MYVSFVLLLPPTIHNVPAIFSLYLTPDSVGDAELTIGGIDDTKFKGSLKYASVPSDNEGTWELVSPEIYVNGKTTSKLTAKRTIVFDSGTTNVLFPTSTTEVRVFIYLSSYISYFSILDRKSTPSSLRT